MTQDKIITKVARIIRKNTNYPFVYSIKIAKMFLNEQYTVETNNNKSFVFMWEWCGIEEKNWNGCIYIYDKDKKQIDFDISKSWKVPLKFYLYQEEYKRNKRN